jgi:hypothetical protein
VLNESFDSLNAERESRVRDFYPIPAARDARRRRTTPVAVLNRRDRR